MEGGNLRWEFLARYKSHYNDIQGTAQPGVIYIIDNMPDYPALIFGVSIDTGSPRLISVSRDRTMVRVCW